MSSTLQNTMHYFREKTAPDKNTEYDLGKKQNRAQK